jgi:hypothetical protein
MMFGGVFIVTGFLHLYFNWKPFKKYFADRVKGRFVPKQEIFIASTITLLIFVVSAMNIPPASWVIDLNSWIKDRWVTSPELEPPFGHAEESTLSGLSRKMQLDLGKVLMELDNRGIRFSGKQDTLEHIARVNNTTPMLIYGMFQQHRLQQSQQQKNLKMQKTSRRVIQARGWDEKPLPRYVKKPVSILTTHYKGCHRPASLPKAKTKCAYSLTNTIRPR